MSEAETPSVPSPISVQVHSSGRTIQVSQLTAQTMLILCDRLVIPTPELKMRVAVAQMEFQQALAAIEKPPNRQQRRAQERKAAKEPTT